MTIFNIDKKVISKIYCKKQTNKKKQFICFIYKSPKGTHPLAQTKFPNLSIVHKKS